MFTKKTKAQVVFTVLLQKQNYELGEQITGNVLFRKDQPLKYDLVRARFFGFECYPVDGKEKVKPISEKAEYIAIADKGKLPAGDTMFPIQFSIPNSLPPSFKCANTAIKYEIQADVLFNGGACISSVAEVCIVRPNPSEISPTFTEKKEWGLLHKESLKIRCIPNKSLYDPSDSAIIELNVNNGTKKDVTRIIVSLVRTLKIGKKTEKKTVCEKEVPRNLLPIDPNIK